MSSSSSSPAAAAVAAAPVKKRASTAHKTHRQIRYPRLVAKIMTEQSAAHPELLGELGTRFNGTAKSSKLVGYVLSEAFEAVNARANHNMTVAGMHTLSDKHVKAAIAWLMPRGEPQTVSMLQFVDDTCNNYQRVCDARA